MHHRYGPPAVVAVEEVNPPEPRASDLLVKVHAATVNRTDCAYRAGKPFVMRFISGLPRPKVSIWGCEFAGEVVGLGNAVSTFAVGDRIFGYNEKSFGGHAQYLTVGAGGMVATIPDNISFENAAAATEGAHSALSSLNAASVGSDDRILVYGATGGIGSAAVQLAKSLGAKVTAVCSTEHVAIVKELGADKVVDYLTEDFTKDDETYDVVLDAVGKSTFAACKPLLKPGGTYLSSELGPRGQNPMLALVTPLLGGKRVRFPIPKQAQGTAVYLQGLLASGAFKPVIDRHFSLDQIVQAYAYVEAGHKIGNVVIDMPS